MTVTGDGNQIHIKGLVFDRECNIKDGYEIRWALSRLAAAAASCERLSLRKSGTWVPSHLAPLEEELERHNREMQRGPGTISGPSAKTEFELCVIGSYQMFYDQALEAVQGIRELWPGAVNCRRRAPRRISLGNTWKLGPLPGGSDALAEVQPPVKRTGSPVPCHGDWDQHHAHGGSYTATFATGCI